MLAGCLTDLKKMEIILYRKYARQLEGWFIKGITHNGIIKNIIFRFL